MFANKTRFASLTVAGILSLLTAFSTALAATEGTIPSDRVTAASANSAPADSLRAAQSSGADAVQDAEPSARPIMPSYRMGHTLDLDLTPTRYNHASDPRIEY